MTVPLYSYDQSFQGYIPERYALKLEASGIAQLVRQKGGVHRRSIRRVVMRRRPGDRTPRSWAITWAKATRISIIWTTAIARGH